MVGAAAAVASGAWPARAGPLQSWDTKIDGADARFVVLGDFDGDAVLDRETQLSGSGRPVSPSCARLAAPSARALRPVIGNRLGWRVPGMEA